MPNKHIELVKKWLADPESVSREELHANRAAARAAHDDLSDRAVETAFTCTAANAAYSGEPLDADFWVREYEEVTDVKTIY